MSDIIHLLPDSVANQIAAGEVIQRPASVVKELVENAIDAGASNIQILIKDAGRSLIQIIDNGKGMSETDARMAFERHATSKIKTANDLFSLNTMGFRGEALASIAAVAQVELKTKREEDELGILIQIAGSTVEKQESVSCSKGSQFSVKNIFFNVPARRKFLKSNTTELNNIIAEFNRIAIINPHISFTLSHNDAIIHKLIESSLRQRIVSIFGKNINQQLLPIDTQTSLIKITGFVGKPESAKKQMHHQYFFVNSRYMRHPYFHKAVMQAFERMLTPDTSPCYFISFTIDPSAIDVNIHPTKTEIKFENEQAIWSIVLASVREALGKFNVVPGIDFNQENATEIPIINSSTRIEAPKTSFNPEYNPFKQNAENTSYKRETFDWEKLYEGFENEKGSTTIEPTQSKIQLTNETDNDAIVLNEIENSCAEFFQFRRKYILTSVKSGLMVIDQHRAHMRILFEEYLQSIKQQKGVSQQVLFPELLELSAEDCNLLTEIKDDLAFVGFDIDCFGKNTYRINGIPSNLEGKESVKIIEEMISANREKIKDKKTSIHEEIALSLAKASCIPYGKILSKNEIELLINKLFSCENPSYSPDGKVLLHIMELEELEKRF
ncbi:MAG: DNA mismatch repair endonuclease MutL [Paludibacteraceae bacterium]|nr:DNA mismatch repair endonuclease MutL [Paludibacteraceae bacterium]MBN2787634.1 DNA mismatch repair endonuclease MutL [Paludibacteraceae bacterium]